MKNPVRNLLLLALCAGLAMPFIGCSKGKTQGDPFTLGLIALERERYPEAVARFEEALKAKPNDPKIIYNLGKAHLGNKAFDRAIEQFNAVLQLDPGMVEAHLDIADAEVTLGRIASGKGSVDARDVLTHYMRAEEECRKAIAKDATIARSYLVLARVYQARNMTKEAIAEIDGALAKDSSLIDAYLAKAELLRRGNDLVKALEVCDAALLKVEAKLQSEQADEQTRLRAEKERFNITLCQAQLQRQRGALDKAIELFEQIVESAPNNNAAKTVRFQLGELYLIKQNWDAAEAQSEKIQEIDRKWPVSNYLRGRVALGRVSTEKDEKKRAELLSDAVNELSILSTQDWPEGLFWLGQAYRQKGGRNEQALTEFRKALQSVDQKQEKELSALIHLSMADLLIRSASYKEAEASCQKALELRPSNTEALTLLSQIYQVTGNLTMARQTLERITEIDPMSATANLQLARMALLSGQVQQAEAKCREAIQLSTDKDPRPYQLLGSIFVTTKQYAEAIQAFEKAISIDPSFAGVYLDLAHTHILNGQRDKAIDLLKDYMEKQPTQPQAPAFLASIYEQIGDVPLAIEHYRRALARDSKYIGAYNIARLYLLSGRIDEAIQKWRELITITSESQVELPQVQIDLLLAQMLRGDTDSALQQAQELRKKTTKGAAYSFYEILVNTYAGRFSPARETLQNAADLTSNVKLALAQLIEECEKDLDVGRKALAKLAYSFVEQNENRFDAAEQHLVEAIALMKNSLLLHTNLAQIYAQSNNIPKLEEVCQVMMNLNPKYAVPHMYLGRIAETRKEIDKAIAEYSLAAALDPQSIDSLSYLARLQLSARKADEAEKIANKILELDENNFQALVLKLAIYEERQNSQAAEEIVARIVRSYPDSPAARRFQAGLRMDRNDYDEAINICNNAIASQPDDVSFYQIKAQSLVRRNREGDLADAIKTLEKALTINDEYVILYLDLARIYRSDTRTLPLAESVLRRGLDRVPKSIPIRFDLVDTLISTNKLDRAEQLLTEVADTETAAGSILRYQIQYVKALNQPTPEQRKEMLEKLADAITRFASSLDVANSYDAYLLLGKIYHLGLSDPILASRAFETCRQVQPKRQEPHDWLSTIYFARGLYADSAGALETLVNLNPNAVYLARLAVAKHADQNLVEAERRARQAATAQPDITGKTLVLANIMLDAGKTDAAIDAVKSLTKRLDPELISAYESLARKLDADRPNRHSVATELNYGLFFALSGSPRDVPAHYKAAHAKAGGSNLFLLMLLARSLKEAGNLTEAAEQLEYVVSLQPNYLAARLELGEVCEMQSKLDAALDTYQKAAEKDPKNERILVKIGTLYHGLQKYDDARTCYLKAIELSPDRADIYYKLGDIYERQGMVDEALDAYDKTIRLAPDSAETSAAYNNAAWHYATRRDSNLVRAMQYATRAKDLAPEIPEIRDTLGWIYYLGEHYDEARHELQIAAKSLAANGLVQYHYAVVLAKVGEVDQAIKILEAAGELKYAEKDKALQLYAELKNLKKE